MPSSNNARRSCSTLERLAVALTVAVTMGMACGDDIAPAVAQPESTGAGGDSDDRAATVGSSGEAGSTESGMSSESSEGAPRCTALFGRPTAATGLTDAMCGPSCPCIGLEVAPTYDEAAIDALLALTLLDPPSMLAGDPYEEPAPDAAAPGTVCGVIVSGSEYRLQGFEDARAAQDAGATVTHQGACGLCSPLADLAVYMRNNDLTEPVRACGLLGITEGEAANLACLRELGFTEPCAQIWLFNTVHTRTECTAECFAALEDPYHRPDGSLNPCLACDEERSGPVFKAVAGRTRRNTGLPSALCRPCEDVRPLTHVYR